MIILSEAMKQLTLIELTVPWEDRMEEAFEIKFDKYQGIVEECRNKGWQAYYRPVELGCGGFAACSPFKTYIWLGMSSMPKRTVTRVAIYTEETGGCG